MENHQRNGITSASTSCGNIPGSNQERSSSSTSSMSSLPQNALFAQSSGIFTPQILHNLNPVMTGQNSPQPGNAISPPPAMLNPFMGYLSSRGGGTITPSIASSYNSNLSSINVMRRGESASGKGSTFNVTTSALKAVTSAVLSTTNSGVIVPGVGNNPIGSGNKRDGSLQSIGKVPKRQRRITSVAAAASSALAATPGPTPTTTLGGVTIPSIHPNASTALQVQIAAATAAAAAAPLKAKGSSFHAAPKGKSSNAQQRAQYSDETSSTNPLTDEEKAKINRDRNREHARSTRLRKKAYVNKLKELVEGLHAERTEESKKNRVATQHLSEVQAVRKSVMRTFLRYLSNYECDHRKWGTLMEDDFWFKQPITPYRSFPRNEIENECRKIRRIAGMIAESASMSVMIEGIGSRSARWMHIKREEFLSRQNNTPSTVMGQNNNAQQAMSSLSSSSGSSNGNGSGSEEDLNQHRNMGSSERAYTNACKKIMKGSGTPGAKKVSAGSSGSEYQNDMNNNTSNEYHVYNAPSLPDPKLSGESGAGSDSTNELQGVISNNTCTDSSSADEDNKQPAITTSKSKNKEEKWRNTQSHPVSTDMTVDAKATRNDQTFQPPKRTGLPSNIAKVGGISHNIRPLPANQLSKPGTIQNGNTQLGESPIKPIPPFLGIGKRVVPGKGISQKQSNLSTQVLSSKPPLATKPDSILSRTQPISAILTSKVHSRSGSGSDTPSASACLPSSSPGITDTSSTSSRSMPQIKAGFHVNEDDMMLTEDVLMCPFMFRSQDAVLSGALAECIMPGMIRAHFSGRNKLLNVEMIYDAMGFMQQLERASGREGTAQIIPNSLDMALVPIAEEPRVITLAKPPYQIVSVNEAWSKMTKYKQIDAEGKDLKILHGKRTESNAGLREGKPCHTFEHAASGLCACSVNRHYDKLGGEYIEYCCSYPLSNSDNDITHILHISRELPPPAVPAYECHNTRSTFYSLNSNE